MAPRGASPGKARPPSRSKMRPAARGRQKKENAAAADRAATPTKKRGAPPSKGGGGGPPKTPSKEDKNGTVGVIAPPANAEGYTKVATTEPADAPLPEVDMDGFSAKLSCVTAPPLPLTMLLHAVLLPAATTAAPFLLAPPPAHPTPLSLPGTACTS